MPVRPVEYHPFQYPRKYRPLGYGSWEPPAPPPPEPVSPRRRRRTVVLILAALLATIVIHVGIAAAYESDGGGTGLSWRQPGERLRAARRGLRTAGPVQRPRVPGRRCGATTGPGRPPPEAVDALRQRL